VNRIISIVALLFFLTSAGVSAQQIILDTVITSVSKKTLRSEETQITDTVKQAEFKPDPLKVIWMGAIIPGYGQILNRKYWKLPLVYGGFLGCAYAISWNSTRYQSYKTAYRDIIDTDPTTNSFIDILPPGRTEESMGGKAAYTATLKTGQENFRRYRDVSIIATIAFYGITLVDAFVDAQLYDFDISPDLSLRFQPTLISNQSGFPNTLGMQCSFRLK
jgi:hypothetical protein